MKEKKYSREHIGETFITNQGAKIKVIDGGSKEGCCTINFVDYNYNKEVSYFLLKGGHVKCKLSPTFSKKGYIGIGKYSQKDNKNIFSIWSAMLKRCYNNNVLLKQPSYIGCSVCEEWHNFQNFAEWYIKFSIKDFSMDKDLLSDFKIYSPETCVFIPRYINNFISVKQTNNTSGYIGVYLDKKTNKWKSQISIDKKRTQLGRFSNIEDAINIYTITRKDCAKDLLNQWLIDLVKLSLTKDQVLLSEKAIKKFKEVFYIDIQ